MATAADAEATVAAAPVEPADDLARASLAALLTDTPRLPPREQLQAYAALAQHGQALAREPRFLEMLWNISDFAVGSCTELHQPAWSTLKQLLPLLPRRAHQHKVAQRTCESLSRTLQESSSLDVDGALHVAESWAAAVRELGSILVGRGSNVIQPLLDLQKRLLEHAAPAVRAAAHRNWKVLTDTWFTAGDLAGPRRWKRLKLLVSPLVYRSSRKGVFRSRVLTEQDVGVRRAMIDSWVHLCRRVGEGAKDPADAAAALLGTESAEAGSLHWEDALLPHLVRTNDEAIQIMLVDFATGLLGSHPAGTVRPPPFCSATIRDRIVPGLCEALGHACDRWESEAGPSAALSGSLQLLEDQLSSAAGGSAVASVTGAQPVMERLRRLCAPAPVQHQETGHNGSPLKEEQNGPLESCSSDRSGKRRKIARAWSDQQGTGAVEEQGEKQEQKENESAQTVRVPLGPNYVRQASSTAAGCFFAARVNPADGEEVHWIHHVSASQTNDGMDGNARDIASTVDVDDDDDEATEQMSSPTGATISPTRCSQHSCGDEKETKCVEDDLQDQSCCLGSASGGTSLVEEQQRQATLGRGDGELPLAQGHSPKNNQGVQAQQQKLDSQIADWLCEGRQLLESLQTLEAAGSARSQAVRVAAAAVGALLPAATSSST